MPVIFIPGIKGSELVDTYPINFPVRWSMEDMFIGNIFEDESDLLLREGTYDQDMHLFREWRPIRFAYRGMIEQLRRHDPNCYLFTYDWRRQIEYSAQKLAEFVAHVAARHARDAQPSVSFVTHSMGGLVLRSALTILNDFQQLHRIVFIAPPFRGAVDALKALVAGEKQGWLSDRESYRKIARSFPSVYQLIPNYNGALVSSRNGENVDPFDVDNWQHNVIAQGKGFSHAFLADAEAFLRDGGARYGGRTHAPMMNDENMRERWGDDTLVLLGAGNETPWQIPIDTANRRNPNWFDFTNARSNKMGDGRVHMKSAAIQGITLAAFELGTDHGRMCREEIIQDAAVMWLKTGRVLKFQPRKRRYPIRRRRKYFHPWNGSESSFSRHLV